MGRNPYYINYMSTTDKIPEYLYTQEDINHIIQENKRLKEEVEELRKQLEDKINLESLN